MKRPTPRDLAGARLERAAAVYTHELLRMHLDHDNDGTRAAQARGNLRTAARTLVRVERKHKR